MTGIVYRPASVLYKKGQSVRTDRAPIIGNRIFYSKGSVSIPHTAYPQPAACIWLRAGPLFKQFKIIHITVQGEELEFGGRQAVSGRT